ncbi:Sorting nexin 1 [Zea mays]|uniref:Sorting nexin 1 n=1 Tax=Zea mays TaxID=4577 RepID=A0A3L6G433_MAIZE|nr:Sorting nexin 1 [Zea mays]
MEDVMLGAAPLPVLDMTKKHSRSSAIRIIKRVSRSMKLRLGTGGTTERIISALHTVLSEQGDEDDDLKKCKTSMCHVGKMQKDVDSACSKGIADNLLFNFEEPLKDYVCAVQSIKATMLDRANAFRQHFNLDQERKYKELNLEKLKFMNPEKYAEAESEFREASLL